MSVRPVLAVALLAALAAAPDARAQLLPSLTIEGFGGFQDLQLSASSAVNAANGSEGTGILGADVLAGIGGFGVGVVIDKVVSGNGGQPWSGALLAGVLLPVAIVRIELLGELGRRAGDFGDLFQSVGQNLGGFHPGTFVGLRPGVSLRLVPTAIVIGVSADARWPTSNGDIGSPDFALVARVGFGIF